jgi:hypothetical protein
MTERPYFPEPHPICPPHTQAEAEALYAEVVANETKWATYEAWWKDRAHHIALSETQGGDPYRYGFELDHWRHADRLLGLNDRDGQWVDKPLTRMASLVGVEPAALQLPNSLLARGLFRVLVLLGGNRSGKSEYCAKRVVEYAMAKPECLIVCCSETIESSILNQQTLIWRYLPAEIKALNDAGKATKRGLGGGMEKTVHINFSMSTGFSLNKIVLPNRSTIVFKTYNQDSNDVEGWMLGCRHARVVGAWLDENAPLAWVQAVSRRAGYYGAVIMWSYTPLNGMTVAIKELVGESARTVMSLPAELLPGRLNVPDCPVGHMPYIQTSVRPDTVVMYFHSILNPFGTAQGTLYEGVKRQCEGRSLEYIMMIAYGFTRDTMGRAWPLFGRVNIVQREQLPSVGTNYQFVDPAGGRNFSSLYVRVAAGTPSTLYIYRDWPDYAHYGEWAVPSGDRNQPDGELGPAQRALGYGYDAYQRLFLQLETIVPHGTPPEQWPAYLARERDPQRRALLQARLAAGADPCGLREEIKRRFIDPRAGRDKNISDKGGTCAIDELARKKLDPSTGAVALPGLRFEPAPGFQIAHGIEAVNTLLNWDPTLPLDRTLNAPRLFVCEDCQQVIWTLEHYTGQGGEDGGCKDFADLLRYLATARLRFISDAAAPRSTMGSYG